MHRFKFGFLLLLMTVLVGGCTLPGPLAKLPGVQNLVDTVAQPRVTEADFAMIEDPVLRKHMVAQANTTAYRIRSDSDGMDEGTQMVQEVRMSGNSFAMSSWQESGGARQNEMIMMGDTTYIKDYNDNTWWKQTMAPDSSLESEDDFSPEPLDFKEEYESLMGKATYTNLGEEPCGPLNPGLTCHKFEESNGMDAGSVRTFWFDTADFLLRQEEASFGGFTSSTTYEYANVAVKAPSPTKDVPEGRNIYEYMSGAGAAGLEQIDYGQAGESFDAMMQQYADENQSMDESFEYDMYDYSE